MWGKDLSYTAMLEQLVTLTAAAETSTKLWAMP